MSEAVEENRDFKLIRYSGDEIQKDLSLQSAREIERYFKEGIIAYSEGVNWYLREISKLKTEIDTEKKLIEKEENLLEKLEYKIEYEQRLLEDYNYRFSKKTDSLQELHREYKDMLESEAYLKLDKRKLHEIQEILDEIEELEMTLLQHELERINLFLKVEPKRRAILALESELKELELDKAYFESTKLYQMALIPHKKSIEDETVDIEAEES